MGPGVISVTLHQMQAAGGQGLILATVRNSKQAASRHMVELGGIGDKAWFNGQVEDGKIGVGSIIVRKANWAFTLDSSVMEYRVSPETIKPIPPKIPTHSPRHP